MTSARELHTQSFESGIWRSEHYDVPKTSSERVSHPVGFDLEEERVHTQRHVYHNVLSTYNSIVLSHVDVGVVCRLRCDFLRSCPGNIACNKLHKVYVGQLLAQPGIYTRHHVRMHNNDNRRITCASGISGHPFASRASFVADRQQLLGAHLQRVKGQFATLLRAIVL